MSISVPWPRGVYEYMVDQTDISVPKDCCCKGIEHNSFDLENFCF